MPTNICEEPTNTVQFTDTYLSSDTCAAPPANNHTYYVPGRAEDLIYRYRRNRVLQHADAQDNQCIRGELRKAAEAYEYRRPDWWPSRFGTLDLRDDKHNLAWAGVFLRAEVNRLERESWDSEVICPVTEDALADANWDLNRVTRKLGDILGLEDMPPCGVPQEILPGAVTGTTEDPF